MSGTTGTPSMTIHASLLEPLDPGGSRRYRTATFDVRTEKDRPEPLLLAPPDAVPVFDGVFLLRPIAERRLGSTDLP
jgi:hypothetical protein